ncbi:MAG: DUF493 family protein [Bacteroidales bacterium]
MKSFDSLKDKLNEIEIWPTLYMFKFIVPVSHKNVAQVESLFTEKAVIYRKESRNGKYISITAKQYMDDPQQIVDVYVKASNIKSIIAL